MTDQENSESRNRSRLQLEIAGARVDADYRDLSRFTERLIYDDEFRGKFQANPSKILGDQGVEVDDEVAVRFLGESLTDYVRSGGDPLNRPCSRGYCAGPS